MKVGGEAQSHHHGALEALLEGWQACAISNGGPFEGFR